MRDCPACGASAFNDIPAYSKGQWRLGACEACGFVYLKNPPEYEAFVEQFAWEKTKAEDRKERAKDVPFLTFLDKLFAFRWKFRGTLASRYLKVFGAGRVLDVGCGRGRALPEPIIPFGIELSAARHAEADAYMKTRGGYAVFGPAIEKMEEMPEGSFDGVLMSSILEHEPDPKAMLSAARRVLRDGGKLYLRLPNYGSTNRRVTGAKWCGFRYPGHVNYFTVPQLRRMSEGAGWAFTQLNRFTPFADNMLVLLTKKA